METVNERDTHSVGIKKREHLDVCGVREVVRFDEFEVVLKTVCGELTVEGRSLKVDVLDTDRGVVEVNGTLDALYYSDESEKRSAKLFSKHQR